MTVSVWPLNIEHLCDTAEMLQLPRGIAACQFSAVPENKVLAGPRWPEGANTEILRDRSRELYGTTLDIVPRHSQFIGVLIKPVNHVEQPAGSTSSLTPLHTATQLWACDNSSAEHCEQSPISSRSARLANC